MAPNVVNGRTDTVRHKEEVEVFAVDSASGRTVMEHVDRRQYLVPMSATGKCSIFPV